MSAEVKRGSGISDLGPAGVNDIPYFGGISDDGNIDEKSDKDRSPTDSETAIDQLDKEGHVGDDYVIRSGVDASKHLLSLRDDEDPVLTFRSALLGTAFACFQAAMNQIYNVSSSHVTRAGLTVSSNPRTHRSPVLLWSCSSFSSVKPGLSFYLEETGSQLDGELATRTSQDFHFTSRLSSSSIPILSVSKSTPSHPLPPLVLLKDLSALLRSPFSDYFMKVIRSMRLRSFSVSCRSRCSATV